MSAGNTCSQVINSPYRKIFELFMLTGNGELSRYKNLFLYSLDKVKEELASHLGKLGNGSKKSLPNPASVVQVFIQESENLMICLQNSYK